MAPDSTDSNTDLMSTAGPKIGNPTDAPTGECPAEKRVHDLLTDVPEVGTDAEPPAVIIVDKIT